MLLILPVHPPVGFSPTLREHCSQYVSSLQENSLERIASVSSFMEMEDGQHIGVLTPMSHEGEEDPFLVSDEHSNFVQSSSFQHSTLPLMLSLNESAYQEHMSEIGSPHQQDTSQSSEDMLKGLKEEVIIILNINVALATSSQLCWLTAWKQGDLTCLVPYPWHQYFKEFFRGCGP